MDFSRFTTTDPQLVGLEKYINLEADLEGVPPCMLATVVKIESGGRNIFQENKRRGSGCGVGLCQITYGVNWSDPDHPTFNGLELLDPLQNLRASARFFLAPALTMAQALRGEYPEEFEAFGEGQIAYYAFAIYNAGETAVRGQLARSLDPDLVTHDDYAARSMAVFASFVQQAHARH